MADAGPSDELEVRTSDRMRRRRIWAVVALAAAVVIVVLAWWTRSDSSSDSAGDAEAEATAATPTDAAEPAVTTGSTSSTTTSTTTSTTEAPSSSTVVPTSSAPPTSTVASTTVAPTTTAVPAPPATVVISYSPFDGDGALVEPVLGSEPGACVGAAFSAHRADAYRCSAGDQIHDPCFAPPVAAPTQVACLASIPGTGVRVLDLTGPLPLVVVPADDPPMSFLFVLDDGTPCTPFTGTAVIVDGIRMDYGCGSAQTGLLLVGGGLDASSRTWTFLTADADRTGPLTSTPIVTAYV